ncbi:hypothetical protein ABZ356_13095 [Micromonospora zamorensis]|uniref:hypothetical protein n=1 Tax=Micromonospora zamorensis TaxID=709883 RepID=UPI0033E87EB9
MDWRDVFYVKIQGWGLNVQVGIVAVVIVAVAVVVLIALARRGAKWRLTKANFRFAGLGQIEICPNNEVAQIAHTAWVELRSRKAAIPFDPDHDVIVEMYNSWYELFRALRELAKTVPPDAMRAGESAPLLAEILLKALNDGLRPHLTCWQAKFRRWYDARIADPSSASMSPQEIQRLFPEYEILVADLVKVSEGMSQFTEELRKIAHERTLSQAAGHGLADKARKLWRVLYGNIRRDKTNENR